MKKQKKTIRKNEIRLHNVKVKNKKSKEINILHPAYIFLEENGEVFIYVTLTHSSDIDSLLTIKLRKNPNPNDDKYSYWVAEIRKDLKNSFTKMKNNWKIHELDEEAIRLFYEKNKLKDDSAIR